MVSAPTENVPSAPVVASPWNSVPFGRGSETSVGVVLYDLMHEHVGRRLEDVAGDLLAARVRRRELRHERSLTTAGSVC